MAGGHFSVTHTDRGWEALRRAMKQLEHGDAYVKAGIIGEQAVKVAEHQAEGQKQPMTNVRLAMIHEFGTETIPERSFIRSTFDARRAGYIVQLRTLLKGVYEQRTTVRTVLNLMGFRMKSDMKSAILQGQGIPPPNAPATLKKKLAKTRKGSKGEPRTLVDTGRLVGSIDHGVVLEGSAPVQVEGSAYGTAEGSE